MIAAAGSGQRLGAGGPKAYVEVAGRPLLAWSVEALVAADSIAEIVIAAPPGTDPGAVLGAEDIVAVDGGATRAQSVRLAMERVEAEVVVVHDAARPLVTPALVDRIVDRLVGSGAQGVIAAAPVADTLKRVGAVREVRATVERAGLWGAQTPQAFPAAALRSAQRSNSLDAATDEAQLVEWDGGTVLVELVEEPNLKVTTTADLALAEALLRGR